MPRFKREVSVEGIIAVCLLVWQLVGGWHHEQSVVESIQKSLDQQAKIIATLVIDMQDVKTKVMIHDYQLGNQPQRH